MFLFSTMILAAVVLYALFIVLPSIQVVGPTEVGLVMKRFGKKLPGDNPIAFHGEAGYQAGLLMPGVRFKLWLRYRIRKFPWVQVQANEIGVVIAQVGKTLPPGAKSACYHDVFGNFTDLDAFVNNNGEKGVQRPVLAPGTLLPIHPVAFLVITKNQVYGLPISPELRKQAEGAKLTPASFNLKPDQLNVVRIEPRQQEDGEEKMDVVSVVTTLEGKPLTSGHIASRLRGFADIEQLERQGADNATLIAHGLDAKLQPIVAKSKEGFVFKIDLQVLIHVPDTKAPKVISMMGTMQNLVNEVLQAAVGNLFRDKLGSMQAINFIETRQTVQEEAFKHIRAQLEQYEVETRGVYIQDVILPPDLVQVLTEREIANQEVKTFEMQKIAQEKRIDMEKSKGTAEIQAELARSEVGITIKSNNATARKAEADGEAEFISKTDRKSTRLNSSHPSISYAVFCLKKKKKKKKKYEHI